MALFKALRQVYPYNYAEGRFVRVGWAIALCTFLFLTGLEPVGVNENARFGLLTVSAVYALIAGLGFISYFGLLSLLPKWDTLTDRWTVGRELVLFSGLFILVGCVNHAMRPVLYDAVLNYDIGALLRSIIDTFKVGLLVLGVVTTINLGHLIRSNEAQAEVVRLLLRRISDQNIVPPHESGTSTVSIGSPNETVQVAIADLMFVIASGNYVEIHIEKNGESRREVLRIPIKIVEEQMPQGGDLIRVHRAFIVNTGRVAEVSGNAQGYQLRVHGTDREVPVSRSYMPVFNAHMAERHGR